MKTKRVIINADDFGFSEGITTGIILAHKEGIVTSTTLMANMPYAAEAVSRLKEVPSLGVGVHLNVSQGPALSAAGKAMLAESSGLMNHPGGSIIISASYNPRILKAIEAEFQAQIEWALEHGIKPTHLDSHRHCHAFPVIFSRVARLAKRYKIPYVRWYGEPLPGNGLIAGQARQKRIRKALTIFSRFNQFLQDNLRATRCAWGVEHTGVLNADLLIRLADLVRPGITEIITHPGLPDGISASNTRLIESRKVELEALCNPDVKNAFLNNGIELIHYGEI